MSADLKHIISEIDRLEAEAKALRGAQAPWPDQRSAYEKVVQATVALLLALPPDDPKLRQWLNYKTHMENFLAQADGEYAQVAKTTARAEK